MNEIKPAANMVAESVQPEPIRPDPTSVDVLVVGGGPTGLVAASQALSEGYSVALVEATERLGGMAASLTVGGQRVDLGSHRLHPSASAAVMELLDHLLGSDLQTRPRNGRVRLAGNWVGFPLRPLDLLRSAPLGFGIRVLSDSVFKVLRSATSVLRPKGKQTQSADTYASVVNDGLGPTILENFYGPYAQKLWGIPAEELAGEVARRRISVKGPGQLAKKVLAASSSSPSFLYPRLGYGQVVDALVAEINGSDKASVFLDTSIIKLDNCIGSTVVASLSNAQMSSAEMSNAEMSNGESIRASQVFWTAAPSQLRKAIVGGQPEDNQPQESGSAEQREPAARQPAAQQPAVPHRGMVLVYLVLDVDQYTTFDAHYFPGLDTRSARISEPKNYRDGPDPAGCTVLCAEIVCDVGDDIWNSTPEVLGSIVVSDLEHNGLPTPNVRDVRVERLPSVYPVIRPEDLAGLEAEHSWAMSLDRIHVFGRQGLVVADNLHHVIEMALGAVSCLSSSADEVTAWDSAGWSRLREQFDKNVVED